MRRSRHMEYDILKEEKEAGTTTRRRRRRRRDSMEGSKRHPKGRIGLPVEV